MFPTRKCKTIGNVLPFFFQSSQNLVDLSFLVFPPPLMPSFEASSSGNKVESNLDSSRETP